MIARILIANRGEIACRVIRSARALGIETVAVYSEADAGARHTQMADRAIAIGPAPAAESYLDIERILAAVSESGADAVHPGYGFLSENAGFAEALSAAGVTFIGPPPAAIASMGDKLEARRIAEAAGVSVIPGTEDAVADVEAAAAAAREIGYPVMIKAAAGGGGKGMRLARSEDELREGVQSAVNEATAAFGDGRVFVERFIETPRHIEIQILADGAGNVIHLGERECSVQRRHQKVIEEAPSPLLDEATRETMGAQACALAKAVGYRSAGTVEFVADQERNFYFLEMNTRLQVEHPVTEMVTGLDLVAEQIRVAAGEPLSLDQSQVTRDGWAIECRIYAEDPRRGFLPSIGRLVRHRPPAASDQVRTDTGVVEGSEITMFYDPMVAKLITHGADRAAAIEAMRDALDRYEIRGIANNIGFLSAIMRNQRFASGALTTGFIEEEFGGGFDGMPLTLDALGIVVPVAATLHHRLVERAARVSGRLASAGDNGRDGQREWVVVLDDGDHPVRLANGAGAVEVTYDNRVHAVETDWAPQDSLFEGTIDGRPVVVQVERRGVSMALRWRGVETAATVRTPRAATLAARMPVKEPPDRSRQLLSPMPGLVVAIPVAVGDTVTAGQPLAVVDAMKMENVLRAERDGRVGKVCAAVGDSVMVDQVILEFD